MKDSFFTSDSYVGKIIANLVREVTSAGHSMFNVFRNKKKEGAVCISDWDDERKLEVVSTWKRIHCGNALEALLVHLQEPFNEVYQRRSRNFLFSFFFVPVPEPILLVWKGGKLDFGKQLLWPSW